MLLLAYRLAAFNIEEVIIEFCLSGFFDVTHAA